MLLSSAGFGEQVGSRVQAAVLYKLMSPMYEGQARRLPSIFEERARGVPKMGPMIIWLIKFAPMSLSSSFLDVSRRTKNETRMSICMTDNSACPMAACVGDALIYFRHWFRLKSTRCVDCWVVLDCGRTGLVMLAWVVELVQFGISDQRGVGLAGWF